MILAVVCEGNGSAAPELLGKARSLDPGGRVIALGEGEGTPADLYAACGADEVVRLEPGADDCVQGTRIAEALAALKPDIVLFPATVRGRFLSAWAAARLQTGLTADCTALSISAEGLLLQSRPAFGGSLTADILCRERRPQMASVRPGVFPCPAPGPLRRAGVCSFTASPAAALMERLSFTPNEDGVSLRQAKVIVAGGKGVGGRRGFEKLAELAHLLGGAVGASRAAVDAGFIGYAHQVGQTGVTVRPELYLAFGISGLAQHIVGMNGAKTVIAVNTDRNAPIFSCADYGIEAGWEETVDVMIRYQKERKGSS